MPPRRKAASGLLSTAKASLNTNGTPKRGIKRKAVASTESDSGSDFESSTPKKSRPSRNASASPLKKSATMSTTNEEPVPPAPKVDWSVERPSYLPAKLCFSYEEARQHLIDADSRFESVFDRLSCRPFVKLERLEPFRTLATSIIGQQISWKAARAVNWRFMRLYDDSLPETIPPPEEYQAPERFPPPHIVAETPLSTLRTVGLSARKAEYIQDLAKHFADGRLSAEKMWTATDEELYESLISVRGIGPWTIDMFAIFSLRRPNILPVGDLGVQRGVLRWILTQHANPSSPVKLNKKSGPDDPTGSNPEESSQTSIMDATKDTTAATGSMVPPQTPKKKKNQGDPADLPIPPPFTPSINRVLKAPTTPIPLPSGVTVANLRSRLNGKTKVKGALLTPEEMEALTESWKPYRSLGAWYMWALTDQDVDED